MRIRGGYNRAERTPNIAELYTTPRQLAAVGHRLDPWHHGVATLPGKSNAPTIRNRAQLQALCSANQRLRR
jgi:hypothetical protein